MGKQSGSNPKHSFLLFLTALWMSGLSCCVVAQAPTQALTVPLMLPAGLVYDAHGNLFFAEAGRHLIRRVSPTGILTTIAGTGVQGFAGDGGPATAAMLDTPTAVALDSSGDLFLADSHNHRIRRIDAQTGTIITIVSGVLPSALTLDAAQNLVLADAATHRILRLLPSGTLTSIAGTGIQGFSGDNGPALQARLDSPSGLAFDSAGNLYIADTHNARVRRVDAATGIISTNSTISRPRGLVADPSGNLLFADETTHRILRIDASGAISLVAGTGTQAYAGDGAPAVIALLDSPQAVTLSPAGLATLVDTGNGRIRQVDAAGVIHTIAGLGSSSASSLTLTAPSVLLYGTGQVSATLASSPATGSITFFDQPAPASLQTLASATLTANTAAYPTSSLAAGSHRLFATYSGDTLHSPAQSPAIALNVAPAPASAAPNPLALLYGQTIPPLTGTLTGILPRDVANAILNLGSAATIRSSPGTYPISATLSGSAAADYTLTTTPASITITKAPSTVVLSSSLAVVVASTTSGVPSGSVVLLDGTTPSASAVLSAQGTAMFSPASLAAGTHTLTASYPGDLNFIAAASAPTFVTIGPVTTPDFTLTANGQTAVTIPAGSAAQYSFAVTPVNGSLSSPILLSATGLPPGATASFNPAYLPPSGSPSAFILTIATPKASISHPLLPFTFALFLPLLLAAKRRSRRILLASALALTLGCGDRVHTASTTDGNPTKSYTITVLATSTQTTGATVQHTTTVTLTLQ